MPRSRSLRREDCPNGPEGGVLGHARHVTTNEPQVPPSAGVLAAFGVEVTTAPVLLPGGQGTTWLVGNRVLKPVGDEPWAVEEADWLGSLLDALPENGFRVSRPIRPIRPVRGRREIRVPSTWTVDGWSAGTWVEGEHHPPAGVEHRADAAGARRPHRQRPVRRRAGPGDHRPVAVLATGELRRSRGRGGCDRRARRRARGAGPAPAGRRSRLTRRAGADLPADHLGPRRGRPGRAAVGVPAGERRGSGPRADGLRDAHRHR